MLRILTEQHGVSIRLADIPNGTIFNGCINGFVSAGPFLKVGSVSEHVWVVVKLEAMEGAVFVSSRNRDATVRQYAPLTVKQVVLRDFIGEPVSVAAIDPVEGIVAG